MPDAKEWIARIKREDPPELWERTLHSAWTTAIGANGLEESSSANKGVGGTDALGAARERTTDADSLDEVKEQLVGLGRERGFVTSEAVLEALPEITPST